MDLGLVLALAALPALGNFAGGARAELVEVSPRTLSLAVHVRLASCSPLSASSSCPKRSPSSRVGCPSSRLSPAARASS